MSVSTSSGFTAFHAPSKSKSSLPRPSTCSSVSVPPLPSPSTTTIVSMPFTCLMIGRKAFSVTRILLAASPTRYSICSAV